MSKRKHSKSHNKAIQKALKNVADTHDEYIRKAAADFQMGPGDGSITEAQYRRQMVDFGTLGSESVSLGPSVPPIAQRLDQTDQPRNYQYRVGWNVPSLPGEGRQVSLATLKNLADTYDILRKAIEIRKDELASCRLDFMAREPDKRRAREIIKEQQGKIKEIKDFFVKPDKVHTWQAWLRRLLEQYFVFDAVTIYRWKTLGGKLWALRLLDGSSIKPLLTIQGDTPQPPDWAYQQYLFGRPVWSFTTDELLYKPKNSRIETPYGFSPVEQFIWHITQVLKFNRFTLDYFTDGTIPEGVAEAPATWTPKQIEEFNDYWTAMLAGDTRALRRLQFVPSGFVWHQFKPFEFNTEFARWLVGITAACMDLTPMELGFEPLHGGLGGKGFAEEQSQVLKRKSSGPIIRWLCDEIVNPIIWEEFGATDLQAVIHLDGDQDEQLMRTTAIDLAIRNGTKSIDQVVEEEGEEPPGIGRIFVVGSQIFFEPDLIKGSLEGAAAINSVKPEAAPSPNPPNDSGTRAVQQQMTDSKTDDKEGADNVAASGGGGSEKSALIEEVQSFLRFADTRRKAGKWRDFRSEVIPEDTLNAMNKAAQGGADRDEIIGLIGMDGQPEYFKRRVQEAGSAYLGYGRSLAALVADRIERRDNG